MKQIIALTLVAFCVFALSQPLQAKELQIQGTDLENLIGEIGGEESYDNSIQLPVEEIGRRNRIRDESGKICVRPQTNGQAAGKCGTLAAEKQCQTFQRNGQYIDCYRCWTGNKNGRTQYEHRRCKPKATMEYI